MVTPEHWWQKTILIGPLNHSMTSNRRTSSISVWTKSQLTDPMLESFYSIPFCLKYIHSNFWLPTLLFIALVRTSYWLFCSIPFHAMYSHISITSLITPTKYTIFIHYIYIYYVPATCFAVPHSIVRQHSHPPYSKPPAVTQLLSTVTTVVVSWNIQGTTLLFWIWYWYIC